MNVISLHRTRVATATVLSLLVVVVALALAAADEPRDAADAIESSRRISTESPPAGAADPGQPTLPDGRYFGRITAAYVAPGEVVFDRRELLVGDEARAAAVADGREALDHHIRDTGLPRVVLPASDDTTVTVVDCGGAGCVEGKAVPYGDFTRSFADPAAGQRYFRVVVDDGAIVRIDEQYFA
jgi:hypothetical protein